MTRRYVAVVLEFEDDETLAEFQRAGMEFKLPEEVRDVCGGGKIIVHGKTYHLKPHPHAPYIYPMTAEGLTLRD